MSDIETVPAEPGTLPPAPDGQPSTRPVRVRRRAVSRPAGPPETNSVDPVLTANDAAAAHPAAGGAATPAAKKAATAKKATAKKTAAKKTAVKKTAMAKATTRKAASKKAVAEPSREATDPALAELSGLATGALVEPPATNEPTNEAPTAPALPAVPLFQPPDPSKAAPRRRTSKPVAAVPEAAVEADDSPAGHTGDSTEDSTAAVVSHDDEEREEGTSSRRRRRRGGRRRSKSGVEHGAETAQSTTHPDLADDEDTTAVEPTVDAQAATAGPSDEPTEPGTSPSARRRRRRRRSGEDVEPSEDDPADTVVRVREPRSKEKDRDKSQDITSIQGSTRLEAKKQRRRDGRDAGRRRPPIVSEAEFLARRESVKREMVIRQHDELTQIAVLEDEVLVEHYVSRRSQTSLIGNVYLGRVQNVLPSMEAAFVDIGKGRNAVLYAGEVNWDLLGKDNQPRKIESALKSGQQVLVQVSKDPVGHKGARLTSQISLPGRFLVYVPSGQSSGISRKLPDTERSRLKALLKQILPGDAGVIIRTAAEGASEEELTRDVNRLTAQWDDITKKGEGGQAPALLYGEPDLTVKVVRDLFTEDFASLVVDGDDAWDVVNGYVAHVAPELADRVQRWSGDRDAFAAYRVDEQIAKGLDRKVFLPSGGSLVIDRTEAMTVVDVNTGKFTGSGGNLEQTVTKNNLEAAEELVRQLRLRDIGGIIVVDFIDMVLESNRELVLRRLIECLGRDRTKHQVAEVTSLGLVQMTRKRIGTGLLEAFSETCEHCGGRGLQISAEPVEPRAEAADHDRSRRRSQPKPKPPTTSPPVPVEEQLPPEPVTMEPDGKVELAPEPAAGETDGKVELAPEPEAVRDRDASPASDSGRSAMPSTRSLLPPSSAAVDDLPPAVTPKKRARSRATKPA